LLRIQNCSGGCSARAIVKEINIGSRKRVMEVPRGG